MRKLLIALVIGVIAWQSWGAYQARTADAEQLDDGESSVTAQLLGLGLLGLGMSRRKA